MITSVYNFVFVATVSLKWLGSYNASLRLVRLEAVELV